MAEAQVKAALQPYVVMVTPSVFPAMTYAGAVADELPELEPARGTRNAMFKSGEPATGR